MFWYFLKFYVSDLEKDVRSLRQKHRIILFLQFVLLFGLLLTFSPYLTVDSLHDVAVEFYYSLVNFGY